MKKVFLMFALLFAFSTSFVSCRETPNEATEAELNNDELDVSDDIDDEDQQQEVPRKQGVGEIDDQ